MIGEHHTIAGNKKKILFVILLGALVFSCKSDRAKTADEINLDETYETFRNEIKKDSFSLLAKRSAEFLSQHHTDDKIRKEAKAWLIEYESREAANFAKQKLKEKILTERMTGLGGYKELDVEHPRCNFFKGYYLTNKKLRDSGDVAYLVETIAKDKFVSTKQDTSCAAQMRWIVYLYNDPKDYDKASKVDWVAMCSITSGNYSGTAKVNMHKLN
jgi:hypothetical protein